MIVAEAIQERFSKLKGQNINLVFEIIWAGYGETDAWGRGAVLSAFAKAVSSCFNEDLYQEGLIDMKKHPYRNGRYQCSLN